MSYAALAGASASSARSRASREPTDGFLSAPVLNFDTQENEISGPPSLAISRWVAGDSRKRVRSSET